MAVDGEMAARGKGCAYRKRLLARARVSSGMKDKARLLQKPLEPLTPCNTTTTLYSPAQTASFQYRPRTSFAAVLCITACPCSLVYFPLHVAKVAQVQEHTTP